MAEEFNKMLAGVKKKRAGYSNLTKDDVCILLDVSLALMTKASNDMAEASQIIRRQGKMIDDNAALRQRQVHMTEQLMQLIGPEIEVMVSSVLH
jgi:hypothetical protein